MFSKIELISINQDLDEIINKNKKYFLLAAEDFNFEELNKLIKASWMGAIFPKIIYENLFYSDKALLCELSDNVTMHFISDIVNLALIDYPTSIVIVDALDVDLNHKLEELYSNTAENSVMFGAGTSRLVSNKDVSMYNGEFYTNNGMFLINSNVKLSMGVKHGYESGKNFYMVTKANNNLIEEIDGKSAFLFYKNYIHENFNIEITEENIFDIGIKYPLLFERTYGDKVVRVPIQTDGLSLSFVGDILQDTTISIGTVSSQKMINAASESVIMAKNKIQKDSKFCIVFSCIGREKYLSKNFIQELQAINKPLQNEKVFGALSIGEIVNTSEYNLELYNSTCVVGIE